MIRNTETNGLVVRKRWTKKTVYLLSLLGLVFTLLTLWGSYKLGLSHGDTTETAVYQQLEAVKDSFKGAKDEAVRLEFSVAKSQRQLQVDRVAFEELAENLRVSNNKISDLAKELVFYQSILSPQQGQAGLQIHLLTLVDPILTEAREYDFEVTLLQGLRHKKKLKGSLRLEVEGRHKETGATMTYKPDNREFNFRYYQKLKGKISLPADLVPTRLVVKAQVGGEAGANIEKLYDWAQSLSQP